MTRDPKKGHAALRRGRWSQSGADYFLTICTKDRRPGLVAPSVAADIFREMRAMEADGTWHVRCATIMPDHAHFLITLGERLTLVRAVQRLKAKTAAGLRGAALQWERGLFDRKMRPKDDCLPVFLYIYLNPYRAGLITKGEEWPDYHCSEDDWRWFSSYLEADLPLPAWLIR